MKETENKKTEGRKIFHIEFKAARVHKYYGSLKAVFNDTDGELGVSKAKLDRYDFDSKTFENQICIIRRGVMKSSGQTKK